ncbi:MAG: 5-formyltetrahydrofolate cyclo-ligase [Thalassobaculaceae bacterium]|nr:5-formyltetrahydrofolate cyclo-ligase [Thalassobaculaceae bacterium]
MSEPTPGGEDPCFSHTLVDGHPVDCETARDVARFRRAERQRLYAMRKAIPVASRRSSTQILSAGLRQAVGNFAGRNVAVYWPIRGEPDLRQWMADAHEMEARILLPVVEAKGRPLVFRRWQPGCRMTRGIWNIPVPKSTEADVPDVVVAPLVGVDRACYRLGNGGGYYDRTLVRIEPQPLIIGVGFAACTIETIFPMPWDVPMDVVVLDDASVHDRR